MIYPKPKKKELLKSEEIKLFLDKFEEYNIDDEIIYSKEDNEKREIHPMKERKILLQMKILKHDRNITFNRNNNSASAQIIEISKNNDEALKETSNKINFIEKYINLNNIIINNIVEIYISL